MRLPAKHEKLCTAPSSLSTVKSLTMGVVGTAKSLQTTFRLDDFAGDRTLLAAHPPTPIEDLGNLFLIGYFVFLSFPF